MTSADERLEILAETDVLIVGAGTCSLNPTIYLFDAY